MPVVDDDEALLPLHNVKLASHMKMGMCPDPSCQAIHLVFCDEDDEPFAQALYPIDEIGDMVEGLMFAVASIKSKQETKQ